LFLPYELWSGISKRNKSGSLSLSLLLAKFGARVIKQSARSRARTHNTHAYTTLSHYALSTRFVLRPRIYVHIKPGRLIRFPFNKHAASQIKCRAKFIHWIIHFNERETHSAAVCGCVCVRCEARTTFPTY